MLDVEIQPLSLSMVWPQLRFPPPPLTNNITSHSCSFSRTVFCKKNKQATSQVRELFLFRFCLFEAWSFARQKNKKTSRSQLDFPESHCSLVSDAQCDLDWAELDNCVPFPDQYLESEHGPRHREAEDRLDSSKLIHGFLQAVTWICQNGYMDFSKSSNSRSIHWAWAWASPHWETEGRLESASLAENPLCELVLLQHNYKNSVIYGTQVQSLPCLVTPSVTFCPFWFSSMLVNVILKVVQWICQNLYVHRFLWVATWIC